MKDLGIIVFLTVVILFVAGLVLIGVTWALNHLLTIFGVYHFQVFDTGVLLTLIYFIRYITEPNKA